MADQFRFDCLRANGNKIIKTPNLDRLAAGAVNFAGFFAQAPVCVPSRISYFTGRYPHSHGNRVNYTPCDRREILMQKILNDAGYQTGSVGKLHLWPPTAAYARSTGFDRVLLDDGIPQLDAYSDYIRWKKENDPQSAVHHWTPARNIVRGKNPYRGAVPYEFTLTHWTGLQTRLMLREFAASSRPFFLYSSFFKPHNPYIVPFPYDSMYDEVEIPLPRRMTPEDLRKLPLPIQKQLLMKPTSAIDELARQWIYRSYYASVSLVDREVGSILEELDQSGKAENTIVLFATDHGDQMFEHGSLEKNLFFESSVHLPFMLRFPKMVPPGRHSGMVESVDVFPTILEYCGIPAPLNCQGRSLAPILEGGGSPRSHERQAVFAENIIPSVITNQPFVLGEGVKGIRHPDAKMVRTPRWKLNYYPGHGGELYDLNHDLNEFHNLYAEPKYRNVIQDLTGALLEWMITADETDQITPKSFV